jgi:hypothetical protein
MYDTAQQERKSCSLNTGVAKTTFEFPPGRHFQSDFLQGTQTLVLLYGKIGLVRVRIELKL